MAFHCSILEEPAVPGPLTDERLDEITEIVGDGLCQWIRLRHAQDLLVEVRRQRDVMAGMQHIIDTLMQAIPDADFDDET